MKRGISLVALVITIIVLIILTATVMIMFNKEGMIEKAEESVFKSDFSSILESYINKKNELMFENPDNITIDSVEGSDLENYIPLLQENNKQIKDKHYEDLIQIIDGKLCQTDNINDMEIERWLDEVGIPKNKNNQDENNQPEKQKVYLLNEDNIDTYTDIWQFSRNPYGVRNIEKSENTLLFTLKNNYYSSGSYGAHGLLGTNNKIDLTDYEKIVVHFDDINLQGNNYYNKTLAYVCINPTYNTWMSGILGDNAITTTDTGEVTLELDISQITGEYYICVGVNSPQANRVNTVKAYLSLIYLQ